jgi:hypothetical protein
MSSAIAQIKKYHFWIVCGLVLVMGLSGWYLATSSLAKEFTDNATKIKAKANEIKTVLNIQNHPNPSFEEGMTEINRRYAQSIAVGWQERYAEQEKLLVWPERLTEEFIEQVDHLRPIELIPFPTPSDKEIPAADRDIYRNFITEELPTLAEQIGAKWYVTVGESGGSGGFPGAGGAGGIYGPRSGGAPRGGSGSAGPRPGTGLGPRPGGPGRTGAPRGGGAGEMQEEEVDNSIVLWSPQNQQEILNLHFDLTARNTEPTTLEVLYAQEDLWVLQAIVNIIKRTNAGADANYNAAIKEIESIQMGRSALGRMGRVSEIAGAPASTGPGAGMGTMAPPSMGEGGGTSMGPVAPGGAMQPPGPGGPGASTEAVAAIDPAMGRYVDIEYNPLPPEKLRGALDKKDAELAIYAVAKRMPVRMRFRMDQRRLNDLLAECGNSSLPVEVRQVRMNVPAGLASSSSQAATGFGGLGGFGGAGAFGGSMGPAPSGGSMGPAPGGSGGGSAQSYGGLMGGGGRGGRGAGGMPGGTGGGEELADPNLAEVEIYGIVHLFNPVNREQLGIESTSSADADDADQGSDVPTAGIPASVPSQG